MKRVIYDLADELEACLKQHWSVLIDELELDPESFRAYARRFDGLLVALLLLRGVHHEDRRVRGRLSSALGEVLAGSRESMPEWCAAAVQVLDRVEATDKDRYVRNEAAASSTKIIRSFRKSRWA